MRKKRTFFPGIPRRDDGRVAWSATDRELEEIHQDLAGREKFSEQRPEVTNRSFEGALRHAVLALWQDQPYFVVAGTICFVLSIVMQIVGAFK
ncbi:MAG: hypothetical protein L6Q60_14135 [Rhodocyclaceae bacterium]|nr:hypothetical protein [Rhodocyclaceae bacterium]